MISTRPWKSSKYRGRRRPSKGNRREHTCRHRRKARIDASLVADSTLFGGAQELRSRQKWSVCANFLARSSLLPAVAVAIRCARGCVLWDKIDIFSPCFFFAFSQRFFVMLFRDEHVKRWHDEQGKDRSDGHAANEHKTD